MYNKSWFTTKQGEYKDNLFSSDYRKKIKKEEAKKNRRLQKQARRNKDRQQNETIYGRGAAENRYC
ncbi:hypothetical protein BDAP_001280 [Binucleata daphniae]